MMTKFLAFEGAEDVPESGQDEPSGETFEVEVLDKLEGHPEDAGCGVGCCNKRVR